MNRIQSKCFAASAFTHAILFSVLVIAPGFITSHDPADALPPLEMLPPDLILTDEPFQGGGGNPSLKEPAKPLAPPPAAPKQEAPPPPKAAVVEPAPPPEPAPRTKAAKPQPEPEPAKPAKDPDDIPDKVVAKQSKTPKPPTPRKPVQVNLDLTKRSQVDSRTKERNDAEAQAAAEAAAAKAAADRRAQILGERRNLLAATVKGLSGSLSSTGMAVDMPGPGGEAYANYRQFVKSVYNFAWSAPEDISDDSASVIVRLIIARDGTVKRSEITTRSGIPALDKSVQSTLNRVRSIGHPFPEGAKEDEREFRLNFNLKSKRSAG